MLVCLQSQNVKNVMVRFLLIKKSIFWRACLLSCIGVLIVGVELNWKMSLDPYPERNWGEISVKTPLNQTHKKRGF